MFYKALLLPKGDADVGHSGTREASGGACLLQRVNVMCLTHQPLVALHEGFALGLQTLRRLNGPAQVRRQYAATPFRKPFCRARRKKLVGLPQFDPLNAPKRNAPWPPRLTDCMRLQIEYQHVPCATSALHVACHKADNMRWSQPGTARVILRTESQVQTRSRLYRHSR